MHENVKCWIISLIAKRYHAFLYQTHQKKIHTLVAGQNVHSSKGEELTLLSVQRGRGQMHAGPPHSITEEVDTVSRRRLGLWMRPWLSGQVTGQGQLQTWQNALAPAARAISSGLPERQREHRKPCSWADPVGGFRRLSTYGLVCFGYMGCNGVFGCFVH